MALTCEWNFTAFATAQQGSRIRLKNWEKSMGFTTMRNTFAFVFVSIEQMKKYTNSEPLSV